MTRRCPSPLTMVATTMAIVLSSRPMLTHADSITSGTAEYTLTSTTTLSAPTGPPPGTPSTTLNSTITNGAAIVTLPSTTGLAVGYGVSGTGIATGTTISAINTSLSQVTLSQNATATRSESLVYTPTIAPPQVVALIEPAGGVVTPPSSSAQGPLTILSSSSGINTKGVYDYLASTTSNGQALQALGLSFYGNGLAAGGMLKFSLNVANQSDPPQLVSQIQGVTITLNPASSSSSSAGTVSEAQIPEPLSLMVWSALAIGGLLRARAVRRSRRLVEG